MKKTILATLAILTGLANANNLTIEGERWLAKSSGYACSAYDTYNVAAPASHEEMDVEFQQITTDYTLDNGLLLGTFEEDGVECKYSAILLADNAASTIGLVESKAYSEDGSVDCQTGKEILDEQLKMNDYLYWGHPHNLTIMIPTDSAEEVCGEEATHVGLNFIVAGRIDAQ